MEQLILLDRQLTLWINGHHHPVLDLLFGMVSRLGDAGVAWMAVAIMLLIFGARRDRLMALIFVSVLVMTEYIAMPWFRELWPRPRPFTYLAEIRTIGPTWGNPSFPSSHAHLWVQATLLFVVAYPRLAWPLVVMTLLSLYSRPYVGNHHVLDVVGGSIVGLGAGTLGLTIASKLGLVTSQAVDDPVAQDTELEMKQI